MAKQSTTTRTGSDKPVQLQDEAGRSSLAERGKEIDAEIDKLLDEIDDVLEENAEEFVKNYVQRGGE